MPWPHLPDDFRERSRSVWVDADSRLFDPVVGHRLYHEYLDQLEFAESVGFDGLIVNEHHQNVFGLMPSPQIMAAALARRTRRAAIILLGVSIALYRPPTRVAEEIAMLDVISGGRIVAGFPLGTPMDANYASGANPVSLRQTYREHHDLIIRSWRDRDVFAWNGESSKLRYVNVWPRPIQQPHPPIWIPADGISSETWDFCAEHGYNYSALASRGYAPAQAALGGFWSRMEELGQPFNPYQAAVSQTIVVAETDDQAQQEYEEHFQYVSKHTRDDHPGWSEAPGWRTERGTRERAADTLRRLNEPVVEAHIRTWSDRLRSGAIAAGSPSSVAEQLEHLVVSLRAGHLIGVFHVGDMTHDKTVRSTRLFAEEVMPRLRHLWSEFSDHWSPQTATADTTTRTINSMPTRRRPSTKRQHLTGVR